MLKVGDSETLVRGRPCIYRLHFCCCSHCIHGTIMILQGWLVTTPARVNRPSQFFCLVIQCLFSGGCLWKVLTFDMNIFRDDTHFHTYVLIPLNSFCLHYSIQSFFLCGPLTILPVYMSLPLILYIFSP